MAAGIPIITTNRGGNQEVIERNKNGVVIQEYKNANQFAKKSIRLLSNKALMRKMGIHGRHLVEKFYNFERMAVDLDTIYKTLVYN
jgi:spore coat protein SA